jgi:short subunit dehydrogenase-like uncharacterized protein
LPKKWQTDWSDGKWIDTVTPVTSRIVLFGATGYTGELTARALVRRGQLPVLAGRSVDRLKHLAAELGDLEIAVADVERPQSIAALVEADDVLISTVGPFSRWGQPALAAAVGKGAHYLDSTGEPPFIQDVFENWSPRARASGSALLTAMGYDYVPGNLAAALALRDAGPAATKVEIGYFVTGPMGRSGLSGGTLASLADALFAPGFARRGGVVSGERAGLRRRKFDVAGAQRSGLSLGAAEHFSLPQTYPRLRDVDVYLGWFGSSSKPLSMLSRTGGAVLTLPPVKKVGSLVAQRMFRGSSGGPDEATRAAYETVVVAETFDTRGNQLTRAVVEGMNPYDFSGAMLAWAADRVANVGVRGVGALGPVAAFGLDELTEGVRQSGIQRTE